MAQRPDPVEKAFIKTQDGVFSAYFSARGLVRLEFPSDGGLPTSNDSNREVSAFRSRWVSTTRSALLRALSAKAPSGLPPIDLRAGTHFQQNVWRTLQRIPPSTTMTYAEVAKAVGRPRAARAVGQACGANPIPVIIPCHRVLAAHGRLGGFSAPLAWKQKLLEREGVKFSENRSPRSEFNPRT